MSQSGEQLAPSKVIWGRPDKDEVKWQVQMLRLQPGAKFLGVITGHKVLGAYTHYWQRTTMPCIGRGNGCLPCEVGCGWRWNGYLDVVEPSGGRMFVATVTRGAYLSCPEAADENLSLRGRYVTLERVGSRPNSPLRMQLGKASGRHDIRDPLDLESFLLRLWGLRARTGGPTS